MQLVDGEIIKDDILQGMRYGIGSECIFYQGRALDAVFILLVGNLLLRRASMSAFVFRMLL